MKVVSLFDGMSCLRIVLDKMGITPDEYYAAEIDKFAIKEVKANWPGTKHIGDVTQWREWDIDWSNVDLITAGNPCQSFSVAGRQLGEKDERGRLLWTMLDIMGHAQRHNPDIKIMIENVKMKREFEAYFNHHIHSSLDGISQSLINSSLVSPQNRERFYWTSGDVTQPERKCIIVNDILDEPQVITNRYSSCKQVSNVTDIRGIESLKRVYSPEGKSPTLTTMQGGHREPKFAILGAESDECLMNVHYKKASVTEMCRLQGVPVDYFKVSSASQAKKMLGNGWQCDTIEHILKEIL